MAQYMTVEERRAIGTAARKAASRRSHGPWKPAADRPDPVALLRADDATRQQRLVPIRWGRMSVSPFTFYRGSAGLMAADLAAAPTTGLHAQLCGDAHLSNFGAFASPERTLLFDVNDFDETLPGPFEWDVKRLAASFVVAARNNGFTASQALESATMAARSYRLRMAEFAQMGDLDVWHSRVSGDDAARLAGTLGKEQAKHTQKGLAKARSRDRLQAAGKLTEVVDGHRRIIENPPLIYRVDGDVEQRVVDKAIADYKRTLEADRRELFERYRPVDIGFKVVGVGSVGTTCLVVVLEGRDEYDPLILQLKEAGPSVLETYLGRSRYRNHAARVVAGQRLMQAASDIFLGWIRGSGEAHRDFYWRQLRDMKGSAVIENFKPAGLTIYAELCGWCLARAHARSGARIAIDAYLGKGDGFDRAIAEFSALYADQVEKDYKQIRKAIKDGRIEVQTGL
jgi:uncharacterized protein (DUF2252 family)